MRVGRYELVRELGRGGFGVVWEARDTELERPVAFKAVRPAGGARVREDRLVREADAAARLSHPNIVTLHDAGRSDHGPWIVMELLRGEALAARLERGPVPLEDALRIAEQVASGLAHAHEHGVVHRDLTPANVFLCEDSRVKLLDFGMASAAGHRRLEGGTPAFMAPEQSRGAPEDERTDVFALGVLLHRMLAGQLPFAGGGAGIRRAPALEVPALPALGELIERMLALDPVARPRDAGEVAGALGALRARLAALPPGDARVVRVRPRRRSSRRALAVGAATAVALVAAAVLAWRLRSPAVTAPSSEPRPTIAVADFENLTGDPQLDGVSGMLITSLEGSRRLSVVTHVRLLDLARQLGRRDVARVDEALGRAVAAQVGAHALLVGTVQRFDALYAVQLAAVDPRTSEHLFTLEERGNGKASIPELVDRLSDGARRRLREPASDVRGSSVRVASALTSSFEAWEHYARGERAFSAARYADAIVEYRKALAADPAFALAHYRIAYAGEFAEIDPGERRAEMDAVVRALDRIPPKEQLLVRAWQAHQEGRDDEARAVYARAVEAYPDDPQVLYAAGDHLYHLDDVGRALPLFERAVNLDPSWPPALKHLVDALSDVGRFEEMEARARAWVERAPSAMAYRALADAEELRGWNLEAAVRDARRAFELDEGSEFQRSALAHTLDRAERHAEAEALLRAAADAQARSPLLRIGLACTLAHQGKRRAADEVLEPIRTPPAKQRRPALLVHLLGDDEPDRARAEARRLVAWGSTWEGLPFALALLGEGELAEAQLAHVAPGPWRTVDEAALAHLRGDAARALELLRPLVERRDQVVAIPATWVAALATQALGRDRELVDLLQRLRREPGTTLQSWMLPRSLYLEATALERLGDRAGARERVDHLLRVWRSADPELRLLHDARALRRRLGSGAGASAEAGAAR